MGVSVLTSMEIYNNYPENILIVGGQGNGQLFMAACYLLKNDRNIHKILLSTGFMYESKDVAVQAMHNVCEQVCELLKEKGYDNGISEV